MPEKLAGWRIDPPVSVPVAAGTRRALGQRRAAVDMQPGPQWSVTRNAREQMFRDFDARDLARRERATHVGHADLMQCLHSMTFGTRNRPSSTSGALRWFSSRWSP